jgi:hypothetical protein
MRLLYWGPDGNIVFGKQTNDGRGLGHPTADRAHAHLLEEQARAALGASSAWLDVAVAADEPPTTGLDGNLGSDVGRDGLAGLLGARPG